MGLIQLSALESFVREFQVPGEFVSIAPFGSGHINDTYAAVFSSEGKTTRYILQRINHGIFKDPVGLTRNIVLVMNHIRRKLEQLGESEIDRKVMTLIPTRSGEYYHLDAEGNYWRMMYLVENTVSYDVIESPQIAYESAKAFGRFSKYISDLPADQIIETIPDFHHTPKRLMSFFAVLEQNPVQRAGNAEEEISFILENLHHCGTLIDLLEQGEIPLRITHNDTKCNNVLMDKTTGKGICVIDLDTVMPGIALFDFADMVRTATSPVGEDEKDISKVVMRMEIFKALAEGYLSEASAFLNPVEKTNLVNAAITITLEQAIRFLGDYLAGDVYYKTTYPEHNLIRTRTQIKLIQSIFEQEDECNQVIQSLS